MTETQSDTLSPSSIAFLHSKLKECVASHTRCGRTSISHRNFVPARLLEVQDRDNSRVKLVDTKSDGPFPYCTLSHCWGHTELKKLTRRSEYALRTGVLVAQLPKTFRQAINVCRQLEIPYIWIDSLCIFQDTDDLADWHTQSAFMGEIYFSALINIAATSAMNSSIGLQFNRNPLATVPFTITVPNQLRAVDTGIYKCQETKFIISPSQQFFDNVNQSHLNKRAWVVQERFLSSRVAHFTFSGVFWECMTNTCSDIYPDHLPDCTEVLARDYFRLRKLLLEFANEKQFENRSAWDGDLYESWSNLLGYYSNCDLSFETDKLVAISGIAERLAQVTGDSFVCGLWKQLFIPQLLWFNVRSDTRRRSSAWVAPTWSWASQIDTISHLTHLPCGQSRELAIVETLSIEKLSSGQIMQASLVLRGRVMHAILETRNGHLVNEYASFICQPSGIRRDDIFYVLLDEDQISPIRKSVLCMAIYEDTCEHALAGEVLSSSSMYGKCTLGILILQQYSSGSDKYRRIGVMILKGEQRQFYKSNESVEEYNIELV